MRFRNAVSITADNFASVFKLLLYRVVTGLLFFSLIYVILKLSLGVVTNSAELQAVKDLVGDFFRSIATGDSERLHAFREDFQLAAKDLVALLSKHIDSIAGAIVGVCLIYLLSRFANGLAVFAVGTTVNDRMSVFARTSFSSAYFRNVGRASLYQVVYVPLSFVYDALSVLACWFLFFYAPSFLPGRGVLSVFIALSLTLTAIVCLEALKMAVISAWMPAMIADKLSVGAAMKSSFRNRKDFAGRFAAFLVSIYLLIVVNLVCATFTFGSALLITIPLSFVFFLCLQFVNYYKTAERKYFLSADKIEGGTPTV